MINGGTTVSNSSTVLNATSSILVIKVAFITGASPMIADGMVVAQLGGSGKGGLMALDLATGAEKWQVDGQPAM